jgi:type IV pilus assembly protein PilM
VAFNSFTQIFSSTDIIGIDIGSESIKMAEIDHSDGMELTTFGVGRHELDLSGYWNAKTLKSLSTIITTILNQSGFAAIKAIISVPSKDVFVTTIDFPAGTKREQIESDVATQAQFFLPYTADEMRLSWSYINDEDEKKDVLDKPIKVVLNALPEFVIENTRNLLEHLSLDGIALENQTLAQIRSMFKKKEEINKDEAVILIDIGSTQTVFSLVKGVKLLASTFINVGSHSVTNNIAESIGLDIDIAEYFKRDLSFVNLTNLPKAMQDYLMILDHELQEFIEVTKHINAKPIRVVLTGGGVYTAGILNYFHNYELEFNIGDPLNRITIAQKLIPYISPVIHELSAAIGLAMRVS